MDGGYRQKADRDPVNNSDFFSLLSEFILA